MNEQKIIESYIDLLRINYISDYTFNKDIINNSFEKQMINFMLHRKLPSLVNNANKYLDHLIRNGLADGELGKEIKIILDKFK